MECDAESGSEEPTGRDDDAWQGICCSELAKLRTAEVQGLWQACSESELYVTLDKLMVQVLEVTVADLDANKANERKQALYTFCEAHADEFILSPLLYATAVRMPRTRVAIGKPGALIKERNLLTLWHTLPNFLRTRVTENEMHELMREVVFGLEMTEALSFCIQVWGAGRCLLEEALSHHLRQPLNPKFIRTVLLLWRRAIKKGALRAPPFAASWTIFSFLNWLRFQSFRKEVFRQDNVSEALKLLELMRKMYSSPTFGVRFMCVPITHELQYMLGFRVREGDTFHTIPHNKLEGRNLADRRYVWILWTLCCTAYEWRYAEHEALMGPGTPQKPVVLWYERCPPDYLKVAVYQYMGADEEGVVAPWDDDLNEYPLVPYEFPRGM